MLEVIKEFETGLFLLSFLSFSSLLIFVVFDWIKFWLINLDILSWIIILNESFWIIFNFIFFFKLEELIWKLNLEVDKLDKIEIIFFFFDFLRLLLSWTFFNWGGPWKSMKESLGTIPLKKLLLYCLSKIILILLFSKGNSSLLISSFG